MLLSQQGSFMAWKASLSQVTQRSLSGIDSIGKDLLECQCRTQYHYHLIVTYRASSREAASSGAVLAMVMDGGRG